MEKFLQIYGELPRAGPGSRELTLRALRMIPNLPAAPRILDLGCGPGAQTIDLLEATDGTVVAVDLLPQMLARTRAAAGSASVADRLETLEQDMGELDLAPGNFDLLWSEGAIYNLGFEAGLAKLQEFVKPGGCVAVSEVVWLKPDPPAEIAEFWKAYPGIASVAEKVAVIEKLGYDSLGHFIFPPSAWAESYYDPMQERIATLAKNWAGDAEGEALLEEAMREITMFRRYSDWYSYAFFVMQRPT